MFQEKEATITRTKWRLQNIQCTEQLQGMEHTSRP